jgi:hypothetical protein
MVRLGWEKGAALLTVLVAASGCYEWAPVRPTELPKLSAGARELERADGGRFEVRRPVTAKITTPWGAKKFAQPRAGIENGTLVIQGDEGDVAQIPLDQIKGAQVGQLSVVDTTASIVVLGIVVLGSVLLFLSVEGINTNRGVE